MISMLPLTFVRFIECLAEDIFTRSGDPLLRLTIGIPIRLRGVLIIVRAGNEIIKADFIHTKRTTFPTKMKIGINIEELE